MATVPGVFYLTTAMGNGGYPSASGGSMLYSEYAVLNDRELLQVVPQAADGTASTAFYPWFDGNANSAGTYYELDEAACTSTQIRVTPNPNWPVNRWAGRIATVVNLTGLGLVYNPNFADPYQGQLKNWVSRVSLPIVSNTANTLTVSSSLNPPGYSLPPNAGSVVIVGDGAFTQYAAIPGRLNANSSSGSCWANNSVGIGPDARMVPELHRRIFKSAPYFYFTKHAQENGLYSGFRSGGAGRVSVTSHLERVAAAAQARGDVIQWQLAIIDISDVDLEQVANNNSLVNTVIGEYPLHMLNLINWLRSSSALLNSGPLYNFVSNPNIYVQVSHPHPDLWGVGAPLAAGAIRTWNRSLVDALPRVALIDMADASFAPLVESPLVNNKNGERKFYSLESLLGKSQSYAIKSVELFERQLLGLPTGQPTTGFPIYLLAGDSIAVGPIPAAWADNCASMSLIGPGPTGTVKPANELIFNRLNNTFEPYDPNENSNTSGTVWASAGPEMSMFPELAKQHPNGFGIIKHAINGASLSNTFYPNVPGSPGVPASGGRFMKSAGEHYTTMLQSVEAAIDYVNNNLGKQADFRGVVLSLGHNDTADSTPQGSLTRANLYAQSLPTFVSDLRADLTTRTSGKSFPIIFRRPQAQAVSANPNSLVIVRNAIEALVKTDGQVRMVDVDDLERDRVDNLHETPESSIIAGRRLAAALVAASV